MPRKAFSLRVLVVLVLVSVSMLTADLFAQERSARFEVGGYVSLLVDKDTAADRTVRLPAIGARFAFIPSKHLALEAESTFYREGNFDRPSPGDLALTGFVKANYNGPATVSLFGVKTGGRIGKIGVFAKARAGFATFHPVSDCPPGAASVTQCGEIRQTGFAMDVGVVVESDVGRRSFIRVDAGDIFLRFGGTNMLYAGSGVPWINYPYEAEDRHQLHLTVGIGVRF